MALLMVTFRCAAHAECRMPERALQLIAEMQQRGLQPIVVAYTAIVSASLLIEITWPPAQRDHLHGDVQGIQPDRITYTAVIEQPDKALELLAGMQRKGLESGRSTYNAAISACEKGRQPVKALGAP